MADDDGGRIAWGLVLVSAALGVVVGFAGAFVVPETVFAFRTAFVGAVCVGLTGGVLSGAGSAEPSSSPLSPRQSGRSCSS